MRENSAMAIPPPVNAPPATFGAWIRDRRRRVLGKGIKKFCEESELDPRNYFRIEHDKTPPPRARWRLERLAGLLEIEPGSPEWERFFELAGADVAPPQPKNPQPVDLVLAERVAEKIEIAQVSRAAAPRKAQPVASSQELLEPALKIRVKRLEEDLEDALSQLSWLRGVVEKIAPPPSQERPSQQPPPQQRLPRVFSFVGARHEG